MTNFPICPLNVNASLSFGLNANYKIICTLGLNARLDTIQAAVLGVKLKYFAKSLEERDEHARFYTMELQELETKGKK